jgi:hypothetical protein
MVRIVAAVLLAALCLVLGHALLTPASTRVVVTPPTSTTVAPAPVVPIAGLDDAAAAEFLAHMTADDVARGVYALAGDAGAATLTDAQRDAIAPLLKEGASLRAELGELRMARRAARESWQADVASMATTLGRDRARALPPRAGRR